MSFFRDGMCFAAILLPVLLPGIIQAQISSGEEMTAQVEITSNLALNVDALTIHVDTDTESNRQEIDPVSEQSVVIRIAGSSGQRLLLMLPDTIELKSDRNRLELTGMRYAVGETADLESFNEISANKSRIFEIPESGELFLRIGGTLLLDSYTDGEVFKGTLQVSASCVD